MWGRKKAEEPKPLALKSGHFYLSRDGYVWCCFKIDLFDEGQAHAVRLTDDRVRGFAINGKYGMATAESPHDFVRELDAIEVWVDETYQTRSRI